MSDGTQEAPSQQYVAPTELVPAPDPIPKHRTMDRFTLEYKQAVAEYARSFDLPIMHVPKDHLKIDPKQDMQGYINALKDYKEKLYEAWGETQQEWADFYQVLEDHDSAAYWYAFDEYMEKAAIAQEYFEEANEDRPKIENPYYNEEIENDMHHSGDVKELVRLRGGTIRQSTSVESPRASILRFVEGRWETNQPASMTVLLEKRAMPPNQRNLLKVFFARAALNTVHDSNHLLADLIHGRGGEEAKLVNEVSWWLLMQQIATRAEVAALTMLRDTPKVADGPESIKQIGDIPDYIAATIDHLISARENSTEDMRVSWKEFCAHSDQNRLRYDGIIGKIKAEKGNFAEGREGAETVAKLLMSATIAYGEIKDAAEAKKQPIGPYHDRQGKAIVEPWDMNKPVPVILFKEQDGQTVTKLIHVDIKPLLEAQVQADAVMGPRIKARVEAKKAADKQEMAQSMMALLTTDTVVPEDPERKTLSAPETEDEIEAEERFKRDAATHLQKIQDASDRVMAAIADQITEAQEDRIGWKPKGYHAEAVFAVNMDTQPRMLYSDASIDGHNSTHFGKPFMVFYGYQAEGGIGLGFSANHTSIDGRTAAAMISGDRDEYQGKGKYRGLIYRFNRFQESEEDHIDTKTEYPESGISFEVGKLPEGGADIVIARTRLKRPIGASTLTTASLFANDIIIQHKKKTERGPWWNKKGLWYDIGVGTNTVITQENEPEAPLVPGTSYYLNPERYKHLEETNDIAECLSWVRAEEEFKGSRYLIDNYDKIRDDPNWKGPKMPISVQAFNGIARSNLYSEIKRGIFNLNASKLLTRLRASTTYPDTTVVNRGGPTLTTVAGEDLPPIAMRITGSSKDGWFLECTLKANRQSEFIGPDQLETFARVKVEALVSAAETVTEWAVNREWIGNLEERLAAVRADINGKLDAGLWEHTQMEVEARSAIEHLKAIKPETKRRKKKGTTQ